MPVSMCTEYLATVPTSGLSTCHPIDAEHPIGPVLHYMGCVLQLKTCPNYSKLRCSLVIDLNGSN